jgi:polar amino acid transport system substrate-binding protein
MSIRGSMKAFAFAAALAAGATLAPAARAEPLRVCADPDNLPFSKEQGPQRGMYVELAELVGEKLNRPVEYTWWYTHMQRRALRNTILQDGCDAVFALPANTDYKVRGLQRSKPFLNVSYAIVAAPDFKFKTLDDLKALRLAVQFSSTPHILLSQYEGFKSSTFRSAEAALEALAKGEVDAAFLWGPVAGFENKMRWNSRWRVTSVTGHDLGGAVAVAVKRENTALVAAIDAALVQLEAQIVQLADKYGFPLDAPVNLALHRAATPMASVVVPAALVHAVDDPAPPKPATPPKTSKPAAGKAPAKAASAAASSGITSLVSPTTTTSMSPQAAAGRVMFNDKCSHCHGTDGYSPVRERDVRFLKTRYSDKWLETATTTIREGRPNSGMPVWKEILQPPELDQILGFLGTIQK